MRCSTLLSLSAALSMAFLHSANALGNGRLLVSAPDNAVSCSPAVVQWVWTGTAEDAMTNTLSVAVVPEDGYSKRHIFDKRSTQLIKRRSRPAKREIAINIAGGSNVPMSAQTWTWSSVGVTPGAYRIALTVSGAEYTSYSAIFTVSTGDDVSCLGMSGGISSSSTDLPDVTSTASSSSADTAAATSTTASSSSSAADATQTSAPSTASAASTATSVLANAQSDAGSSDSSHHGGKIAAAVLVPIIAIGLVFLYFCLRRKKNIAVASSKRKHWSEKAVNMLNSARQNPSHSRNISHPVDPVHAGGMANHGDDIRAEMQEARNMPGLAACVMSPTGAEHWVDFAGETDACPVTPNDMEEIVRASMDQQRNETSENGLYQQGENVALRESMFSGDGSVSTSSAASTLPAYLRDFASPAPSFGQDANGRSLVGQMTSARSSETASQSSTVTHQLSRNGSIASTATIAAHRMPGAANSGRDLTRNNSQSGSIRRKPVPRESSVTNAITSDQHGPFADSEASETLSETTAVSKAAEPPITRALPHLSMVSGPVIGDDQLQEILDSESQMTRTPRQSHYADAPMSVYDSPAPSSNRGSSATVARFTGRPLVGPTDVDTSELGSPFPGDTQNDAWKLSVRLSEHDQGFHVSFPDADDQ